MVLANKTEIEKLRGNLSLEKFAQRVGVSRQTLDNYLKGRSKDLNYDTLEKMAESFQIDINDLLSIKIKRSPMLYHKVPIYGNVPCSEPYVIGDNIIGWKMVTFPRADFLVRAKGDSMNDLGIVDGAYIAIKKTQTFKSRDIVLVCVGGECCVKQIHISRGNIILIPPDGDSDFIYPTNDVKVIGKVIGWWFENW